jgi:hypothetical protein
MFSDGACTSPSLKETKDGRMGRVSWIAVSVLMGVALATSRPLSAQDVRKTTRAVHVSSSVPVVDGRLKDVAWDSAVPIRDFTQKVPLEGAEPSVATEVRLLYDSDALYVAARMYHPNPESIRATLTRRDEQSDAERIVIALDTYLDRRTAYTFGVSAAGVRFDAYHPEDNDAAESRFNPVWAARVQIDDQGWTAEMRIPFTQLRFNATDAQLWGLEISRFLPARNEEIQWVLIPRESAGFASNFGDLEGIEGIRASRRFEILPYSAGDLTLRSDVDPADPFEQKVGGRMGVDLKMGLGPNLTLDVTVNPDFGQVEADPSEVNLTAFETIFPERRPFFVEGNGALDGRQGYIRLPQWYYSRRVGAPPQGDLSGDFVKRPPRTTIASAAKITGRLASGLSLGVLAGATPREHGKSYDAASGVTTQVPVEPAAAYGVLRLQQEVGRQQSAIGLVLTSTRRSMETGDPLAALLSRAAYTAGVDWKARMKDGMYEVTGFAGVSRVDGDSLALQGLQRSSARYFQRPDQDHKSFDPHLTSMSGYTVGVRADKNAGRWTVWGTGFNARSPGFEINDLGQMRSSDDLDFNADFQLRDTDPGKIFRFWQLGHFTQSAWSYGGVRHNTVVSQTLSLSFHNFWDFRYSTSRMLRGMSDNLTRGGPLMGTPSGWTYDARLTGNPGTRVGWDTRVTLFRDELEGFRRAVAGGLQFRLAPRWQASLNVAYVRSRNAQQYLTRRDDGAPATFGYRYIFSQIDQSQLSTPVRLNYAFTPDLTVEVYAEPFAASGRYSNFGEIPAPRARDLRLFGADGTSITAQPDGSHVVTDGGDEFTIRNLDFKRVFLRSNLVVRWKWAPGSTLFLVWQQNRARFATTGGVIGLGSLSESFAAPGDNFLAIKVSYWTGLR